MAERDQRLMDHDLAAFHAAMREGIHGAPPPAPSVIEAWLHGHGLAPPLRVVAIQFGDGGPPRLPARHPPAALLRVHPGLAYLCAATMRPFARMLAPRHLLVGASQDVVAAEGLVKAIQDALLALRRRELVAVRRRRGASPDFAAETGALLLVLDRLRGGAVWEDALTVWIEIVLCRHSGSLHTIRRKMIELLASVTRDLDRGPACALALREGIARIYDTFALTALAAAFREVIATVAPLAVPVASPVHDPLIRRALALMQEGHAGALPLPQVARRLGVSPEHLSRSFTRAVGTTFSTHLTALRLATARELLGAGEGGILEVALASGFGSVEHFHRTFRRAVGVTPTAWRRAHRA